MKAKSAPVLYILLFAAAVGLRSWQLLSGAGDWSPLGLAGCAVLAAGMVGSFFYARRDQYLARVPLRSHTRAISSIVCALLICGISLVSMVRDSSGTFRTTVAVCAIGAILAGLLLFLQGCLFCADGQNFFAAHPLLAMLLPLWCALLLVLQYRVNVSQATNLHDILRTVAIVLLLLGLLTETEVATGVREITRGRLGGWVLPAVMAAGAAVLPELLHALCTGGQLDPFPPGQPWLLLTLAFYLLVCLLTSHRVSREQPVIEEVDEIEPEEAPVVRPVVVQEERVVRDQRPSVDERPVVTPRGSAAPLFTAEKEALQERQLVRLLHKTYGANCYFHPRPRRLPGDKGSAK